MPRSTIKPPKPTVAKAPTPPKPPTAPKPAVGARVSTTPSGQQKGWAKRGLNAPPGLGKASTPRALTSPAPGAGVPLPKPIAGEEPPFLRVPRRGKK
jgi:hypothetical protein